MTAAKSPVPLWALLTATVLKEPVWDLCQRLKTKDMVGKPKTIKSRRYKSNSFL